MVILDIYKGGSSVIDSYSLVLIVCDLENNVFKFNMNNLALNELGPKQISDMVP